MRLQTTLISTLLFCIVLWIYWPSADSPFQFDDALFLDDDNVKLGRWQALVWPPAARLLPWISFLGQYQIHGPKPEPYHIFNILLHGLNTLLVFLLLGYLLSGEGKISQVRSSFLPFFGALVFALHPLQTEAVLYTYQRSTLLAACFSFLTLLAYRSKSPRLTLAFLVLALLSKELTVVLPLVLWFMDGLFHQKWKPDRWLAVYLGITLCAGLGFLISISPQAEATLVEGFQQGIVYAFVQVRVLWFYIGLTLVPASLNLDHDVSAQGGLFDPGWWMALALLALLFWLVFRLRTSLPEAAFFTFLYFAFLLPTSSFVPSRDYMFEHRLYTSLFGFAGLVSLAGGALWSCFKAAKILPSKVRIQAATLLLVGAASGLLLTYTALSKDRQQVWSDEVTLWRDTAEKSPHKYRPNYNLGVVLMERSPQEAIVALSRAIGIDPKIPLAYRSLGQVYFNLSNLEAAERLWRQALNLSPNHMETHLALGQLYARRADFFRARQHLAICQELVPSDGRSYFHLAQLNLRFGFLDQAIIQSQMGLNRNPDHIDLRLLLADSVAQTQNWTRAVELYQEVIQQDPDNSQVYYRLARAYWTTGRRQKALDAVQAGIAAADSEWDLKRGRSLLSRIR